MGQRKVIAVGDSSYAVLELLHRLSGQIALISRLDWMPRMNQPHPLRPQRKAVSAPKAIDCPHFKPLVSPKTVWQQATITDWYGGQTQPVSYCSQTAIWYHTGKPPVAIRWVLVKWKGKVAAFSGNDVTIDAVSMLGIPCVAGPWKRPLPW